MVDWNKHCSAEHGSYERNARKQYVGEIRVGKQEQGIGLLYGICLMVV